MKNFFLTLIISFLINTNIVYGQEKLDANQNKITNALVEYYKEDRENIHLHLNKSVYLTEEEIWFKGYIIEKKDKKPYAKTTNVYIKLLDENGLEISSKLYFAENSTFEGDIKLSEKLKSGDYYLQVYTNYMNNFLEDESSVSKITIINTLDSNYVDPKKINFNTINVDFFPEGGNFLEGIQNSISFKINDCNGNGIIVNNVEILDGEKNVVTTVNTDKFGFGKFEINGTKNEVYKISFEINEKKIEKNLPLVMLSGITISANNYTISGKTFLKIKSNLRTISKAKDKKYALIIQQNDNVLYSEFTFKENKIEETIIISSDQIPSGINTVYVLDENLKKISERILFKPIINLNSVVLNIVQKINNKIEVNGISPILNGELSISILPVETFSEISENNIGTSFIFENYLINKIKNTSYFLSDFSKSKHAQLDTQLIASKSKYDYETNFITKPKNSFEFDQGLNIMGKINGNIDFKNSHIQMKSLTQGLNEETEINEKSEYLFKNIIVIDSSIVHFSLIDESRSQIKLKQNAHIVNNNQKFLKPFKIEKIPCLIYNSDIKVENIKYPKLKNAVSLDSISIKNTLKSKNLVHNNVFGNSQSRGFKIDENEAQKYQDIITFIRFNGFDVKNDGINVVVLTRSSRTLLGSSNPALFLDDSPIDANFLLNINMRDVDEIFVNKSGFGAGSGGANGVIRIYTKKTSGLKSIANILSQSLFIEKGFQPIRKFTNPKYENINTEEFQNFGTIHWEPKIKTDDKGVFQFSIPDMNQKAVKVIIEGISSDGQIISETKILEIK